MIKQLSILIVGNFLSAVLGSRSLCEDFAERLLAAGYKVTTTSRKPGRFARMLDMLRTVWGKRHQYHLATIDVFSGLSFLWAEIIGFLLFGLGKPFILILHGGNLPVFSRRHPVRVRRLFKLAAAVTTPSRFLQEKMQPFRTDLILLPNPLLLSKYKYLSRAHPKPVLMWLRSFHEIYNAPMAIQVLRILVSDHSVFHLIMAGPDKGDRSYQEVKRMTESLGLSGFVQFHGRIPNADVPGWLQKGDIFLNTSIVDNTPISILEAMASGLCIVSTNVGGLPYLLEDGHDALLVPPGDSKAMAVAVHRILEEPGLASTLSKNARHKVEQFDWSLVLPQWEALFSRIVDLTS
jgi:glycosyltransferase involved in cell wall biosynthesis